MLEEPIADPRHTPAAPPSAPHSALWLWYLFFRPRRFFSYFPAMSTKFTVFYATYVVGISAFIDRISTKLVQQDFRGRSDPALSVITESWATYWGYCLVGGAVAALFLYAIGGWWYRARLGLCGDQAAAPDTARRVYIFASLVLALPTVLIAIAETAQYASPRIAGSADDDWFILMALVFPFWSVYTSYRGVRTVFDAVRWKVRIWFLLLPAGFYLLVIVGLVIALTAALALGALEIPPDVDHPITIERQAFSLRYPGNWWVDDDDEDYDADSDFLIEPMQDAFVQFYVEEGPANTKKTTRTFLAAYHAHFVGKGKEAFTTWGGLSGHGVRYAGTLEGSAYVVSIFTTTTESRHASIIEICAESVVTQVEPGFALIRRSFAWNE